MKTKAIIFDLDGTAIDSPGQKLPSKELVAVVNDLKSQYFLAAATGRCWTFAKDIIQTLELEDLCIISGGTQICNPKTGEIVWQKDITPQALEQVISIFSKNGEQKLIFNDYTEDDYFNGGVYPKNFDLTQRVNWLSQSFVPDSLANQLRDELNLVDGITCVMVVSQKPGCRDLHIVNVEATKEHAITELLSRLDVKKEHTIGIGDGHNDLHLFNSVGTKVAMGNAVDDLKEVADLIIGDVREDGLAKYFSSLK
ncbi:MAG: HAD family phosphatase [Candidatus Pacebacteria bacterium]|nr:HAD family phosphatase [Candidatus Paceibacterota bacterium]